MHTMPVTKIANESVPASMRIGGAVRILLSPKTVAATDGFLGTISIEPGDYLAEQYHPYSDKYFYLVRGRVTMRVDGTAVELGPDEAVMVRRGQRHRIDNAGTQTAFFVFQISPLAPRPELGHVDTEPLRNPEAPLPQVGAVAR